MTRWLLRYWPWAVAFAWLIGYELAALIGGWPTLSQIATGASVAWWPLPIVATGLIVVLVIHFWGGKWWRLMRERWDQNADEGWDLDR